MLPAQYRSLGLFWWTAQLYARLMEPNPAFKAMLQSALELTGLKSALESHEIVVGIHVRHGDSCLEVERSRTARVCEPLSVYIDAIKQYLAAIGCRTLFIATDSEVVLRDAKQLDGFRILYHPNVTRFGLSKPPPSSILDKVGRTEPPLRWTCRHRRAMRFADRLHRLVPRRR